MQVSNPREIMRTASLVLSLDNLYTLYISREHGYIPTQQNNFFVTSNFRHLERIAFVFFTETDVHNDWEDFLIL